jgi:YidC/Oxa1 family membrane protein insertase
MIELFNTLFTNPIINLLVGSYQILAVFGIPYAFGFAIILLTVLIRLILWPFTAAQIRSAADIQKVAPLMRGIREKYKDDKKRQQEEMMRLYREHKINPAAGCLPLLIQIPVIWALYHVLTIAVGVNNASKLSDINKVLYFDFLELKNVWDTMFFGIPLADTPINALAHAPYLVLVPVLTGAFQFVLSKMMMPEEAIKTESAIAKKTETKADDFQVAFQKQALLIFPLMIGVFSFTLPVGLSLYWNAFTIFGILQQYLLVGPGGAAKLFGKIGIKKNS